MSSISSLTSNRAHVAPYSHEEADDTQRARKARMAPIEPLGSVTPVPPAPLSTVAIVGQISQTTLVEPLGSVGFFSMEAPKHSEIYLDSLLHLPKRGFFSIQTENLILGQLLSYLAEQPSSPFHDLCRRLAKKEDIALSCETFDCQYIELEILFPRHYGSTRHFQGTTIKLSPLNIATLACSSQNVTTLLKNGHSPNKPVSNGVTPYGLAVLMKSEKIMSVFEKEGANSSNPCVFGYNKTEWQEFLHPTGKIEEIRLFCDITKLCLRDYMKQFHKIFALTPIFTPSHMLYFWLSYEEGYKQEKIPDEALEMLLSAKKEKTFIPPIYLENEDKHVGWDARARIPLKEGQLVGFYPGRSTDLFSEKNSPYVLRGGIDGQDVGNGCEMINDGLPNCAFHEIRLGGILIMQVIVALKEIKKDERLLLFYGPSHHVRCDIWKKKSPYTDLSTRTKENKFFEMMNKRLDQLPKITQIWIEQVCKYFLHSPQVFSLILIENPDVFGLVAHHFLYLIEEKEKLSTNLKMNLRLYYLIFRQKALLLPSEIPIIKKLIEENNLCKIRDSILKYSFDLDEFRAWITGNNYKKVLERIPSLGKKTKEICDVSSYDPTN